MRYSRFINNLFQQTIYYKANLALEIFGKTLGFFIFVFLWLSIAKDRGDALGMTVAQIMTYFLIMELTSTLLDTKMFFELQKDVQTGKIGQSLLMPLNLMTLFMIKNATRIATLFMLYILPLFLLLFLIPVFALPSDIMNYLGLLFFMFLGGVTSTLLLLCLGSISFWTVEITNAIWGVIFITQLFGGRLIPLPFFPFGLGEILSYLPTAILFHLPGMAFLGKLSGEEILHHGVIQLGWICILYVLLSFIWKKGIQRVEVVGS